MPTERKINSVQQMRGWLEECTVAISADFSGMSVNAMNDLRQQLRGKGVQFRVVKNTLAHLAADAAGLPGFKQIIEGPTGVAFGYGDPTEPARTLAEYIRTNRSPLTIRGGLMDERVLSVGDVSVLASLPSRDELLARLFGQLQAPVSGLVNVLSGPMSGLARVLQARADQLENEEQQQ